MCAKMAETLPSAKMAEILSSAKMAEPLSFVLVTRLDMVPMAHTTHDDFGALLPDAS